MKNRLVDSCGWLEYFRGGPNAGFFEPALRNLKALIVPTICLAEVFKIIYRERGRKTALKYIASMHEARVIELDRAIALNAGLLSVNHKLPLADAIILATARAHQARVLTQDADLKQFPEVDYIRKK